MSTSSRRTAVFGAGPGLGFAAARHFAELGDRLELVARNRERLERFAAELGPTASARPADLSTVAGFDRVHEEIVARGPIDLVVWQVAAPTPSVQSPLELTAENERPVLELMLLTPIHALRALLAPMLERGTGSILVTLGASSLGPVPSLAQLGPPQAALRLHVLGLVQATQGSGVRVGLLVVGGLILGSDIQTQWVPTADADFPGALDPGELALRYDELLVPGAPTELVVNPYAT